MFDTGNPQEVKDAVEALKSRHPVGHFVLKMDADEQKTFRLRSLPRFAPGVEGGGGTQVVERNGDRMVVSSGLNLDNAKKVAAKHGLQIDFTILVAHELGHAWYLAYVNPDSKKGDPHSDAMALAWENSLRDSAAQRHKH
jgi:hypothetical protein